MLPDVGTLPGAVSEARLDDFPLLEGQRLVDAYSERDWIISHVVFPLKV